MSVAVRRWPALGLLTALACATAPAPAPQPPLQTKATPPPPAAPAPKSTPPALRLPGTARPTQYAVDLTLTPSAETFEGVLDVDLELSEAMPVLWLNASNLTVKQATFTVAGQPRPATAVPGDDQFLGFSAGAPIGPGSVHLKVAYSGKVSPRDTQGLFHQQENGNWYAFSQFEASDARRAFPCLDEPAYKVPWQLTLHVPRSDSAFSNTPVESEREEPNGMKAVRFARTRPLPSYLVALAVGPFETVDGGKAGTHGVPVRIVVTQGQTANAAYAARNTAAVVNALEQYFGVPYPYEKLDLVAVPLTGTFGAMENPGLVTFVQRLLAWPPAERSAAREHAFVDTAAHELAHQWFGDLVTMVWWDDIWLNESFASWMGDRTLTTLHPAWGTPVAKVNLASTAMGMDSLVTARAVRQPIRSRGDVVNAFDGITYGKGEALLTMFERYVGPEKFRLGVRRYLQAHAFGNATAQDFVSAISAEAGQDLAPAFFSFLDQPGVPLVNVRLSCEKGQTPRLELSQRRYLPLGSKGDGQQQHWQIPFCAHYPGAKGTARACTLLTGAEGQLELPGSGCPAWVMPNAEATGYYQFQLEGKLLDRLVAEGARSLSMPERVSVVSNVGVLADLGAIPAGTALALVPRLLAGSDDRHLLNATVPIVEGVKEHLVPADQRATFARYVRDVYGQRARALGFKGDPADESDDSDEMWLQRRTLIELVAVQGEDAQLASEARALAERWLKDHSAAEPIMVDAVLRIAGHYGDAAFYERLRQAAKAAGNQDERIHLLQGMAAFRTREQVKANFDALASDEFDIREAFMLLAAPTNQEETREYAFELFKSNYDTLTQKMPRETLPYMSFMGGSFCDAEHRASVETFFKERTAKEPGGERVLAQVLEGIDLCAAKKAAQEPSVAAFLKDYAARPASAPKTGPRAPASR